MNDTARTQQPHPHPVRVPRSRAWILGIRPRTLPASVAPILVGCGLAIDSGEFRWGVSLAALFTALLLQIGANLANDLFDYRRGTDTPDRVGPTRVTSSGMLSPATVALGMGVCLGLAALTGLYLVWRGGWPIALVGALSILAALGYTAGPFPLSYHGLGEVAVFLFFGPVAVVGTYYLQALDVTAAAWVASVPMGALITAILIVNNYRDIDTDRAVGKKTLAVVLGQRGTRLEYKAMLAIAYLSPLALLATLGASPWMLLPLLSAPIALRLSREIDARIGTALNATLAGTARLTIYFGGLLAAGLAL